MFRGASPLRLNDIYIQVLLIQILSKIFYNNMFLLTRMRNKVFKFIIYYNLVMLTL